MTMTITREIAQKVCDVVAFGLVKGVGKPVPDQMCVEAAVCYALGLPHGDDPGCVSPALRRLKIRLNDSNWSSDAARGKGLRRLAVAQLGSKGELNYQEFSKRVVDMTIRWAVPIGLRAATGKNPKHASQLEAAAIRCEKEGTREACLHAKQVAYAYAADAATYAADADADADTAAAAAYAAAYAAAENRDKVLGDYAEKVVEILIDMKAPGCQ